MYGADDIELLPEAQRKVDLYTKQVRASLSVMKLDNRVDALCQHLDQRCLYN